MAYNIVAIRPAIVCGNTEPYPKSVIYFKQVLFIIHNKMDVIHQDLTTTVALICPSGQLSYQAAWKKLCVIVVQ